MLSRVFFPVRRYHAFVVLLFMIVTQSTVSFAQNDTIAKKPSTVSKNFGLSIGLIYSNMSFESRAYFADSSGKVGKSQIENSAGISFGVSYLVKLGHGFIFRPSIEGVILPVQIKYDTEVDYRTSSNVWPATFEFPFYLIYSRHEQGGMVADRRYWPEVGIGIRPIVPLNKLADLHPTFKTFNLNAEVSLGFPFKMKLVNGRAELFYSHGFNNIIGTDETDYKTYTIDYVGRSYFGLRLVFN